MSQLSLEEIARKAITLYNRHKMPEATAKLVNVSPYTLTISFTGSFCYNCSVLDYIEDFIGVFKILTDKVKLRVVKTRQTSPRSFEADYTVRVM
jgi:hypothetical protein